MANRIKNLGLVEGEYFEESISKSLADLALKYNLRAPELVGDLYAVFVCKGANIRSINTITELAREVYNKKRAAGSKVFEWQVQQELIKRQLMLTTLVDHPMFRAFSSLPALEATEKTLEWLQHARKAYQNAQSMGKQALGMGQANGGNGAPGENAMSHVEDPDAGQADQQYSEIKEDESIDVFNWAMHMMDAMQSPAAGGLGRGICPYYDGATGNRPVTPANVLKLSKALAQDQNSKLWNLALIMEGAIKDLTKERKDSPVADDDFEHDQIENTFEIQNASGTDMADEELSAKKISTKDMDVIKYSMDEEKKQLLHVIVDISGSMGITASNFGGSYSYQNSDVAKAVVLALLIRAVKDKEIFFMRTFGGRPGPLKEARSHKDLMDVVTYVNNTNFSSGGGTNIQAAVLQALKDIEDVEGLDKAELLVISDAEDTLNVQTIKNAKAKAKAKMNFLLVSKRGRVNEFKLASDKFLKVDYSKGAQALMDIVEVAAPTWEERQEMAKEQEQAKDMDPYADDEEEYI